VNALEVRVQAEKVDFVVNGTVVHSAPKTGLTTDGTWGFRSNHLLDIDVDGLAVSKEKVTEQPADGAADGGRP